MPAPISRSLADSQSLHELRPSGDSDLFSLLLSLLYSCKATANEHSG